MEIIDLLCVASFCLGYTGSQAFLRDDNGEVVATLICWACISIAYIFG